MRVKDFYKIWLEEVKKPMLAYQSFYTYKNCVYNYIIPLYVLDIESWEEQQDIETFEFPEEMEELLKEC